MRRREFLATGCAAAFVGTGCIGGDDGENGGSAEGGPETTVRDYMEARDSGDVEEINSLLHEDGELPAIPEDAELDVDSVEVEEIEVLNESENEATVRAVVNVRPRSPDEGERTEETEWELRKQNGEWKLWDRLS
jgi:ketosteroid isomerase-like protein